MKIKTYWQSLKDALGKEQSTATLHASLLWGVWIAFCPFVGLHTALAFISSWIFSLNLAIVLGVSMFINNPWTMIPVYYADYKTGIFLHGLCNDYIQQILLRNPQILSSLIEYIQTYISIPDFYLFPFLIGGITLACFATICAHCIFLAFSSPQQQKDNAI